MKFSSTSTELQRVLGNIGGVIPSKSTLPILENFLFNLSGDQLKITATDLDISMINTVNVKGSKDGSIAVPAKRLFETVRSLPNVLIDFISETDSNKIKMLTTNGEYKLTGEASDNYPSLPSFKGLDEIEIENDTLKRLIGKTSFAVSSDELRPAMMGIYFQIQNKEIRTVATDGHRLVRLTISNYSGSKNEHQFIVPAKAMNLVLKSAGETKSKIAFNENHTMFSLGDIVLISRMIEEKYPNYESVIPQDNEKTLKVNKSELLASVRRTSLYASTTTHQVRFSLKKGNLTISAEDIDLGNEAKENLLCEYSSDPMDIGFNSAYIIDILSHVDTEDVVFKFSSSIKAAIILPSEQREGEDLLMLIMPVRLNT